MEKCRVRFSPGRGGEPALAGWLGGSTPPLDHEGSVAERRALRAVCLGATALRHDKSWAGQRLGTHKVKWDVFTPLHAMRVDVGPEAGGSKLLRKISNMDLGMRW